MKKRITRMFTRKQRLSDDSRSFHLGIIIPSFHANPMADGEIFERDIKFIDSKETEDDR